MHLFLTDRIICPQCDAEFGLILLAHEVRNHRVLEGDLGCHNCRENYPVRKGFADLRKPPRTPISPSSDDSDPGFADAEASVRLAALLGVTEGPGTLLIKGPAARVSSGLVRLVPGVEVVGLGPDLIGEPESEGVSRMVSHPRIPFFSDSLRAILLSGQVEDRDIDEAVRVVAPSGRVVVLGASLEDGRRVEAMGMKVILKENDVLVARKEHTRSVPLVTLRGL
jgi:uncharacterized protein YbaR (Trm112 family)